MAESDNIMNRYTLEIKLDNGHDQDVWEFVVITHNSREYVLQVLEANKDNFDSPVELMDYLDEEYGIKWEDFSYDMGIVM